MNKETLRNLRIKGKPSYAFAYRLIDSREEKKKENFISQLACLFHFAKKIYLCEPLNYEMEKNHMLK